jgi:hypothetical protein
MSARATPPRPAAERFVPSPRRLLRAAVVIGLAAAAGSCGKRTPPEPLTEAAPVPSVSARQFGESILIGWNQPSPGRAARFDGLEGFVLTIDELPFDCLSCEPLRMREIRLDRGDASLVREAGRMLYLERPEDPRRNWRIRVAYRFGDGRSLASVPVLVRGLEPIPQAVLRAELGPLPSPAEAPGAGGEARLTWEPPMERRVIAMTTGLPPAERILNYRANVYRRVPGEEWPHVPLNAQPVEGTSYVDRPSRETVTQAQGRFEYAVRWVNQAGGEGRPSEPIEIAFPMGAR